jgi:hypothetical protein
MELTEEFNGLKERIFQGGNFIGVDANDPDFRRYNEIAGILYGLNKARSNDV